MAQPETRIVYTERPDTDPEAELSALINAYRFILFKSKASKKAAELAPEPDGRKDGTKAKGDSARAFILPETP
jgi:hypothetical protein